MILFCSGLVLIGIASTSGLTPVVGPPPKNLGLSPFYKKHVDVLGLPIVSSEKVPDAALIEAHRLASKMLEKIPSARAAMIKNKLRIAIMAESEVTTDIPEHSDLNKAFPQTDWNKRARGLGATKQRPAVSAAEENLLGYRTDRYRGESIFIHEFAHAIMDMGLRESDPNFNSELDAAFKKASEKGLWKNTYAGSNRSEYWAEGVQSYFDSNRTADQPDGIHNHVGTRDQLAAYDPPLYNLIRKHFSHDEWRWFPPKRQEESGTRGGLSGEVFLKQFVSRPGSNTGRAIIQQRNSQCEGGGNEALH